MTYQKPDLERIGNLFYKFIKYVYESTPTESSKGGTMLYVDKQLTYRLRKDLMMYKSKEIESTFIELFNNNNLIQF